MIVALTSNETVFSTLIGLELLGIIYLAIAVSRLRARIAFMEGKLSGRKRDEQLDA